MSFAFPFEYAEVESLGTLFYPVIRLEIKTVAGWREFEFLIDTGADVTTVPFHLLSIIGLNPATLRTSRTFAVGGFSLRSWEFRMTIRLGNLEFPIHANAVQSKEHSLPLLLGRKDVFEKRFNLLLDSTRKQTVISVNK